VAAATPAAASPGSTTFASARADAVTTLLRVYGSGGSWRLCDRPGCPTATTDWGIDSLTYALYLDWQTTRDPRVPRVMSALLQSAPVYGAPCNVPGCQSWSDVPEWDAIAALREYAVLHDSRALANAEKAYAFVRDGNAFARGACPDIDYQQPAGGANKLKTLETDANAIKAGLLLYGATHDQRYLVQSEARYVAVRAHFLEPDVPLYSVYVFDDGSTCRRLPHRFFASVNGDMTWSGLELWRLTGRRAYLTDALATAHAMAGRLSDPAGVFADLQAENDVVEPLVEAMVGLATQAHAAFARAWILRNAAAALGARATDGSFGRFFDGPAPTTTVTAWQTNGGLALEIAAGALDPRGTASTTSPWSGARNVVRTIGAGETVSFVGSGIALYGTLGEQCCEAGHVRVLVDGRETFDATGIWQDKSSLGSPIPGTVLFAWRWPTRGRHTLSFPSGVPNGKEGGSFLHVVGYRVIR
jgi:hypothetical protein